MIFPESIFSGYHGECHCQGIAVDKKNGFIYYSFTTKLVKSDLQGNIIGSADGLIGHLGCIDFRESDGKVYASLEYKNDVIGKGILSALNLGERELKTGFYCAVFDVDKIDRLNMNAETDGIMKRVYLTDVIEDFSAGAVFGGKELPHKYACSGIDGLDFGPSFDGGEEALHVCYGIYKDLSREDNDYQVILEFSADNFDKALKNGVDSDLQNPELRCDNRYFLYTGNTDWGVQNLEYDSYTGDFLVAVYEGSKPNFPNYNMFVIDGKAKPIASLHRAYGEEIKELSLVGAGACERIGCNYFPFGSTGTYAFGNGYYYFSEPGRDKEKGQYTVVRLYKYDPKSEFGFSAAVSGIEIN